MKNLLIALLLSVSAFSMVPAEARSPSHHAYTQKAWPNEADLQSHRHYINKDGRDVHSPSKSKSGKAPAGASAKCGDGSYSFSKHASGTCSRHGGVSVWQ